MAGFDSVSCTPIEGSAIGVCTNIIDGDWDSLWGMWHDSFVGEANCRGYAIATRANNCPARIKVKVKTYQLYYLGGYVKCWFDGVLVYYDNVNWDNQTRTLDLGITTATDIKVEVYTRSFAPGYSESFFDIDEIDAELVSLSEWVDILSEEEVYENQQCDKVYVIGFDHRRKVIGEAGTGTRSKSFYYSEPTTQNELDNLASRLLEYYGGQEGYKLVTTKFDCPTLERGVLNKYAKVCYKGESYYIEQIEVDESNMTWTLGTHPVTLDAYLKERLKEIQ